MRFFAYDVRKWFSFILLHIAIQFSQHHLLKRLSFSHCILLLLCERLVSHKNVGLSKGYKHSDSKGHMHPNIYSSNVHNSPTVERCLLTDEWIKKRWYIYTMEFYSAIINNEILPFAMMWMELEDIMLSEISQSREKQIPCDFTHMWN